jgi:competence protein ComEA
VAAGAARRTIPGRCAGAARPAGGGPASYSYFGARSVTLAAPGGEPGGGTGAAIFLASTPENYAYGAGTSFAAPHVSGALALLFSREPGLEAQRAIDILRETATPLDGRDPAHSGMLGAGQLNIRAALESLRGVPAGGGGAAGSGGTSGGEPRPALFDINTATAQEFAALPLLGPWTAARIVAWREAHGPFSSIQDLTRTGVVDAWTVRHLVRYLAVVPCEPARSAGGFAVSE